MGGEYFVDNGTLDWLDENRAALKPDEVAALDGAMAKRAEVPGDFVDQVRRAGLLGQGAVAPEKRDGMLGAFMQEHLRYDMRGRSVDDAAKEVFGRDAAGAWEHLSTVVADLDRFDPFMALNPEQQAAEGQAAAEKRVGAENKAKGAAASVGLWMPGVKVPEPKKVSEKDVQESTQKIMDEAMGRSPKLMYEQAAAVLSPKGERLAWTIAMHEKPEDAAGFYAEDLAVLPPEQLAAVWQMGASLNPEIDAGFGERMVAAVATPVSRMGKGLADYARGQGWDLVTLGDNAREVFDRSNGAFSADERGRLAELLGEIRTASGPTELRGDDDALVERLYKMAGEAVELAATDIKPAGMVAFTGRNAAKKKELVAEYVSNWVAMYEQGGAIRAKEKAVMDARQAFMPRYKRMSGGTELFLDVTEGAVYMAGLALVSRIPVVGEGIAGAMIYAPQQTQWEKQLVYDHHVEPGAAKLLSSGFAVLYSGVEKMQIKGLEPGRWKPFIGSQEFKKLSGHYLGEWFKRGAKQSVQETGEEWLQTGIEQSMLAAAQQWAGAQGIDWSEQLDGAWREMVHSALVMPGITFMGGGMLRGASSVAAARKGGLKGAVGAFFPEEWKAARADMKQTPAVWQAGQKARVALDTIEKGDVVPLPDAVFYETHKEDENFTDPASGESFADVDAWMQSRGYNPEVDRGRFETTAEIMRVMAARKQVELDGIKERLDAAAEDVDDIPLPMGEADPFWGNVDEMQARLGAALGVELVKFDTLAEAQAAFPELPDNAEGAAFVGENKLVLVKETIGVNPAIAGQKYKHELYGHLGLNEIEEGAQIVEKLRAVMGDEAIRGFLGEAYAEIYDNPDIDAEEMLAGLLERLDPAKIDAELAGGSIRQRMVRWFDEALGVQGADELKARDVLALVRDVLTGVESRAASDPAELSAGLENVDAVVGRINRARVKGAMDRAQAPGARIANKKGAGAWIQSDEAAQAMPVANFVYENGGIVARGKAMQRAGVDRKQGDYDGAGVAGDWAEIAQFIYGGSEMPSTMAQYLYEAGLIDDATPDAMWEALKGERDAYRKKKARESFDAEREQYEKEMESEAHKMLGEMFARGEVVPPGDYVWASAPGVVEDEGGIDPDYPVVQVASAYVDPASGQLFYGLRSANGFYFELSAEQVAHYQFEEEYNGQVEEEGGGVAAQKAGIDRGAGEQEGNGAAEQAGAKEGGKGVRFSLEDYRGTHQAPMNAEGSAPGYDLTQIYPDDIYGPMAAQYYGHYGQRDPLDVETMSLIRQMRDKPNRKVKVYRAVPKVETNEEIIARYERQKKQILKTGRMPTSAEGSWNNSSEYYGFLSDEIDRLEKAPPVEVAKFGINRGDWITINRKYAVEHGKSALMGKYRIVSKTVPIKHIFTNGDSIHEWGYDPAKRDVKDARFSLADNDVKTGVPFDAEYVHNPQSATDIFGVPDKSSSFDRGFEPSGKYINLLNYEPVKKMAGLEYGRVSFNNPLVMPAGTYGEADSWKRVLSEQYGGLTGKALSKALVKDGYDAVVTVDDKGRVSETLDLTSFDESKARFSLAGPVDSPAFKKWFGDSKVVDENGEPLVVYHGTAKNIGNRGEVMSGDFTVFDAALSGKNTKTGAPEGSFFFSDDPEFADSYTVQWQGDFSKTYKENANIMPVYLNMQNPLVVDAEGWNWRQLDYQGEWYDINELAELVKNSGIYDGLVVKNVSDRARGATTAETATTYIAFEPNQIKSATGNIGTFDPNNPDIRYSLKHEVFDVYLDGSNQRVEVIKNPDHRDYQKQAARFRQEYPAAPPGSVKTRSTIDTEGNTYIWYASDGMHFMIEPGIKKHAGREVNQNNPPAPRYSLKSREDPVELTRRVLAARMINGDKRIYPFDAGVLLKQMKLYLKADDEKLVSKQVVDDAAAIAAKVLARESLVPLVNELDVSTAVNKSAEEYKAERELADVEERYAAGGVEWQRSVDAVERVNRKRLEKLRSYAWALSRGEMDKALKLMLEDVSEGNDKEHNRVANGGILTELKRELYYKAKAEGLFEGDDVSMLPSFKRSWMREGYRNSLRGYLVALSHEFTFGNAREQLMRQIAGLGKYPSVRAMDVRAREILDQVRRNRVRQGKEELIERVGKATETFKGRFESMRKPEHKRRVKASAEAFFKHVRKYYLASAQEVEKRIIEVRDALTGVKSRAAGAGADLGDGEHLDEVHRLTRELHALMMFGNLKGKTLGEAAEAVDFLENRVDKELERQEARRIRDEERHGKIRERIAAVLPNRRHGEPGDGWLRDFNSASQFMQFRLLGLARWGKGAERKEAEKELDRLAFEFGKANFKKNAAVAEDNEAFTMALLDIYGGGSAGSGEVGYQVDRHGAAKILRELSRKRPEFERFSVNGWALSKANLMQLVGMLAQEDYRKIGVMQLELEPLIKGRPGTAAEIAESLWTTPDGLIKWKSKSGYELGAYELERLVESVQGGAAIARRLDMEPEMLAALSKQDMELIEWFRDYYRDNREELNRLNRKITGFGFPLSDQNYLPAKKDIFRAAIGGLTIYMPVVPMSLSPRTFNTADFDEQADLVSMWQQRLESNQQFLKFAELYLEVQGVFNDKALVRDMRNTHGRKYVQQLFDHMRDVVSGQPIAAGREKALDAVTNFMATTRLGFNVSLLPRQVTSLPAFAMYVPTGVFFRSVAGVFTSEGRARMREILDHPYAKTRLRGGNTQVVQEMLNEGLEKGLSVWDAYKRIGTIPTRYGDIVPTLIFGQGYLAAMREDAKRQGMQPEEGNEWAMEQLWRLVEMSQQSGAMVNLAQWQRSGGSFGRMVGQFHSTPQQFWAKQVFDWRELQAAFENRAFESERLNAAVKQFGKTSVINFLVLGTLYNLMKVLWNAMLGDLPEEEDWIDMAMASLSSPFGGMLVVGTAMEAMMAGGVKGERGYGSSVLPASGVIDDMQTVAAFFHHLTTGEPDEMIKDADRIMRSLQPLYRDAAKIKENYVD